MRNVSAATNCFTALLIVLLDGESHAVKLTETIRSRLGVPDLHWRTVEEAIRYCAKLGYVVSTRKRLPFYSLTASGEVEANRRLQQLRRLVQAPIVHRFEEKPACCHPPRESE